MDTKLALHRIKEVSPTTLAVCACGFTLALIPISAVAGPIGLAWASNLLYSATNERISIVQGEE
jgi:ABC-type antimicrobial peptide transport system permease subunit